MATINAWDELGREPGELLLGDSFLTENLSMRLIVKNPSKHHSMVSLKDAKRMLAAGEIKAIADDEGVLIDL